MAICTLKDGKISECNEDSVKDLDDEKQMKEVSELWGKYDKGKTKQICGGGGEDSGAPNPLLGNEDEVKQKEEARANKPENNLKKKEIEEMAAKLIENKKKPLSEENNQNRKTLLRILHPDTGREDIKGKNWAIELWNKIPKGNDTGGEDADPALLIGDASTNTEQLALENTNEGTADDEETSRASDAFAKISLEKRRARNQARKKARNNPEEGDVNDDKKGGRRRRRGGRKSRRRKSKRKKKSKRRKKARKSKRRKSRKKRSKRRRTKRRR